jgi:hypothetical protein
MSLPLDGGGEERVMAPAAPYSITRTAPRDALVVSAA